MSLKVPHADGTRKVGGFKTSSATRFRNALLPTHTRIEAAA